MENENDNKRELKDFIINYGVGVRDIAKAINREPSGIYKWLKDEKGLTLAVWYEIKTFIIKIKKNAK